MIDSLTVENFRCFEKLTLENLGWVNVVVGDNGAGKTSLLEAISLGMGSSPELAIKFRLLRGLGGMLAVSVLRSSYEALWRDLFYRLDQRRTIRIKLSGTAETRRSLRVSYAAEEATTTPIPLGETSVDAFGSVEDASVVTPITFEWKDAGGTTYAMKPVIDKRQLAVVGTPMPALAAFFSSAFATVTPPSESATQFSELSKSLKDGPFRRVLKDVFPQISDLSVETDLGTPMLYCKVPWLPQKVPVGMVSSGIHKLMSILLGIADLSKGVVLVDELENGLYYKAMPRVWKALHRFGKAYKTQLFVSTHSKECLEAALPALQDNESDFRLIRVENQKGKRTARLFKGKDFEAAIETDTEVR